MATKSCPPPLRDPGELDMEHRRRKATAVKPGIIKFTAALLSITATPTSAFFLLPPFRLPLCNVHPRGSTSTMMAYDVRYSPNRWRDGGDIVPGVGGVWPGDPNAKTYHVRCICLNLAPPTYDKCAVDDRMITAFCFPMQPTQRFVLRLQHPTNVVGCEEHYS